MKFMEYLVFIIIIYMYLSRVPFCEERTHARTHIRTHAHTHNQVKKSYLMQ